MRTQSTSNITRRSLLKAGAGLGLLVALPPSLLARAATDDRGFEANAFVAIGTDGKVTVQCKFLEMGQGTHTGVATLVAEELDAAWDQLRVEGAPADSTRYANRLLGGQGTGGSTAMADCYEQMRTAGASARAMLVAAAAARWSLPASEVSVESGIISHAASGRSAGFGEFAEAAAQQPVPEQVNLKSPSDFRLIGKAVTRIDSADKVTGRAQFTQDVDLPGMRVAVMAHSPRFGAQLASVDDSAALKVEGVHAVVSTPRGVAVLARDFWSAKLGRDALAIRWDERDAWRGSTEGLFERYSELARAPGLPARREGDAGAALAGANQVHEATFRFPYLAHVAMEPMNCVMHHQGDRLEVWNGEQLQFADQFALAQAFGLPPERVALHQLYAGGSFGRRANPQSDYLLECAAIILAAKADYPVKLVWTREDDTLAGFYRPLFYHRVRAALGDDGLPQAWEHRLVGQSIAAGTSFEAFMVKDGVDASSVEGAENIPYAIPNIAVELHSTNDQVPVPVQWWRSVGSTHTAHAVEVFIDELAVAAKRDPVAYRKQLLASHPRHLQVISLAAEKAGWATGLEAMAGKRRGRGIAVHESFRSFVAQVVEVSVGDDGTFAVDRVVCAVDCGVAINPDVIRAQMEGGIGFALAAALFGEVPMEDGVATVDNFDGYKVLRMPQMPAIEVYLVPSEAPPTGVGEPGVPPLAPALSNALYAATGRRYRDLPLGIKLA
ncbi:MAG: isoquinoline 1-oxidoreductase beta subunit [Halieaceae bacterium]|jgi:isoquinoline 1-oxidoreductase beta subunit